MHIQTVTNVHPLASQLSIGVAVYDDFYGLWPTIQALRLNHPEIHGCEFVIINNNPSSEAGKTIESYAKGWIPNCKYLAYTERIGTAAPRDEVFKQASGKYVVVMDSHILFPSGAFKYLLDYYQSNPETSDLLSGPLLMDDLNSICTHFQDEWRSQMWGTWGTDDRGLDNNNLPFEIFSMGLGVFSCRKDAWLGFNKNFKQFGGEECYIHEKFRQKGHKCLCIPGFKWNHRFGRPTGVQYPLSNWHKARNYFLGLTEIGKDVEIARHHFVDDTKVITQKDWDDIVSGRDEPVGNPTSCGGCNKNRIGNSKAIVTLEDWYDSACSINSDIQEHLPWLRNLSEGKDHIVIFGGHHDFSTAAIVAGKPKKITIVDPRDLPNSFTFLKGLAKQTEIVYLQADDRSVDFEDESADLLFIDSVHTADFVYAQLINAHAHVSRILLHDTEIYGENGEGGGPGILPAVRRFLSENRNWIVVEQRPNNNGMMLLSRLVEDQKELPSIATQGWNYLKHKVKDVLNKHQLLEESEAQERLSNCWTCPFRKDSQCTKCGCYLDQQPNGEPGKVYFPLEFCPIGKWHAK